MIVYWNIKTALVQFYILLSVTCPSNVTFAFERTLLPNVKLISTALNTVSSLVI